MKKSLKRIALLVCCSTILSGCSTEITENIAAYPLTVMMTTAEVIDYYAKSIDYDAVVSRNIKVHKAQYEMNEVSGKKKGLLQSLVAGTEKVLSKNEYSDTEKVRKLISKGTYDYIKALTDDMILTNGVLQNIQGALGYYFVDVDYDITPSYIGKFKDKVNLAGLKGAFKLNFKDEYEIDNEFLVSVAKNLDEYFFKEGIKRHAEYNKNTNVLEIQDGVEPIVHGILKEKAKDTNDTEVNSDEETVHNDSKNNNNDTEKVKKKENDNIDDELDISFKIDNDTKYTILTPQERRIKSDIPFINSVIGGSASERAKLPELTDVFEKTSENDYISGYGIVASGTTALKTFGYDRNQYKGKITLRYVFKDDSSGTGEIFGKNIYCTNFKIDNGVNVTTNNVLVPEFLMSKLKQLVDRSDRALVNNDLAALIAGGIKSGLIYEDIGHGVLRGFKDKNTKILKYISNIRQVVSRDTSNNLYLLDVETTTIDGPSDVDIYGTYKDRYYVVAQQQNSNFVIVDSIRVSREMTVEPQIDPDSNIQKKLVALNLAGDIGDGNKENIKELMSNFYTAGSNKIGRGPKKLQSGDNEVTIEKGIFDCFTDDKRVMSEEELNYNSSKLLNILDKYGKDTKSIFNGKITEWIGGYDNQAEFTTEEFIYYPSKDSGYYMRVYYLVSVNNDVWVIDERSVLDEASIVETETVKNICERVGIERNY